MNNNQKVRMGFSVLMNRPGRAKSGMKRLVYKPWYDDPSLKPKPKKRKTTTRRKSARK